MTGRRSLSRCSCCRPVGRRRKSTPLFQQLTPDRTGVTFANTITTDDSLNVLTDAYPYNGVRVAIGDINTDGLPDSFLAGTMVSSRLYLTQRQEAVRRNPEVGGSHNEWEGHRPDDGGDQVRRISRTSHACGRMVEGKVRAGPLVI